MVGPTVSLRETIELEWPFSYPYFKNKFEKNCQNDVNILLLSTKSKNLQIGVDKM